MQVPGVRGLLPRVAWSETPGANRQRDAGTQLAIPSPGVMEEPEWHAVADAAVIAAVAAASRHGQGGDGCVGCSALFPHSVIAP